jgi:hypothetical protein
MSPFFLLPPHTKNPLSHRWTTKTHEKEGKIENGSEPKREGDPDEQNGIHHGGNENKYNKINADEDG